MELDGQAQYGRSMPFVAVASKDGPYEDGAYAAGWEMGSLDTQLTLVRPERLTVTVRSDNLDQAYLIAMRHGYQCSTRATTEPDWTLVTLSRAPESNEWRPVSQSVNGS
jgi:hypothetical protein